MTPAEADQALLELAQRRARRWRKFRHCTYATLIPLGTLGLPAFYIWGASAYGHAFIGKYLIQPLLVLMGVAVVGIAVVGLVMWWIRLYDYFHDRYELRRQRR